MYMYISLRINVFRYKFLFAVVSGVHGAIQNLDLTVAMPHHSSSSETRPKKRRKIVEFVDDPEGSLPFDNDNETRPESTEETESAEAYFVSHRLSISHSTNRITKYASL